jgi:chemotaxis protein methyltransferase CheR
MVSVNDSKLKPSTSDSKEYHLFRTFLEEACGILLGDNKAYLVNSRLKPVMAKHDIKSLNDLVAKLKSVSFRGLKEEVIDAMTTNETLWFRDSHPFTILKDKILSEAADKNTIAPLKIWSAACSTGQEPYSISIIAKEFKESNPGKLKGGVKIVATDISPTVLANAKSGIYEMLALGRGMSEQRLKKCFNPIEDGRWEIKQEFKSVIDFQLLNLMESYNRVGANLDVVFCRNVLIYFSPELKRQILLKIHASLKPGGYLLLGASESLNGLSDYFEMIQCRPGIIYRAKK